MSYREEKDFKLKDYQVELTGDMSPTLRPENKESMHHMGGAAGESVYLYYEALIRYFQARPDHRVQTHILSFGFGMGYNEILTILFYLKNKKDVSTLKLFSHEKDLFLYGLFNQWLNESSNEKSIFDDVFLGVEKATENLAPNVEASEIKNAFKFLLKNNLWIQGGPIYSVDEFSGPFDVVFYDAFSAKTNDFLWTEDFLNRFFETRLNPHFVFSTYACTGVLKRVAANHQSHFEKRPGFKGKRDSTMILRSH